MSLVIYIGAVLGLLQYLGITHLILAKFGWLMSKTFHTTGVESVSLVANLFLSVVGRSVADSLCTQRNSRCGT